MVPDGVGSGYRHRVPGESQEGKMNSKVTTFLAIVVVVVWAASMVLDAVNQSYDPPAGIHGALMLVLGGVFGARIVGKGNE